MPKGWQKGDRIDAKTHPKYVSNKATDKIIQIIKHYIILMGKIYKLILTTMVVEAFADCVHEPKVQKQHQK